MARIWIVEDHEDCRELFAFLMEQESHDVETFATCDEALSALETGLPDAMIVDIGLPGGDGLEICRAVKGDIRSSGVSVTVVTGHTEAFDRYRALGVGADDFLTKPVDTMELVLRIRNCLRRTAARSPSVLRTGDLALDAGCHQLMIGTRRISLTPSEFAIMRHLMARPGQAVDTETLLVEALGYPPRLGNPEILRTHVRRLRRKIEEAPEAPQRLVNMPRLGYRVVAQEARRA